MPYSSRVGAGYATGFTTALTAAEAETADYSLRFYTGQELHGLFEPFFQGVEVVGINYAGNLVAEMIEAVTQTMRPYMTRVPYIDPNLFAEILAQDPHWNQILDPAFARHMMVIATNKKLVE